MSDATDVVIEDVLPDSLKFVSANGTYENDGLNVKWVIDKVEGKSSVSVYVVGEAVTNGSAVNFANVTCRENSTSNTTTDKIDVKPVVNLTVVKTANASNIYVGDGSVTILLLQITVLPAHPMLLLLMNCLTAQDLFPVILIVLLMAIS